MVNNYKPYNGNNIVVKKYYPSDQYKQRIIVDMLTLLKQNKRISMCVSSKTLGDELKAVAIEYLQDKSSIKMYHGDAYEYDPDTGKLHKEEKAEDFKDVNVAWASIKLLIYTGTLSVGVDFSPENSNDNFDTFINVFQNGCSLATQFIQSFCRCRKFKDTNHILYIQHNQKNT